MKDQIQRSGSEVSVVIYDAPLPPKYFRFSKRFIRTLFITLPIVFGLAIGALFLWGLSTRLMLAPRPSLPQLVNESDIRIAELENELRLVQESNQRLVEKVGETSAAQTEDEPYLMAIRKPYGMQNLIPQNIISLGQIELQQEPARTILKFQITNPNPDKKISGHIIVYMISETGIRAYPAALNEALAKGIKYSAGESFSVARLRPTNAEFTFRPAGEAVKFLIFIFNREGDLLVMNQTEPFKLGTKP
jgi:hypothetical protein